MAHEKFIHKIEVPTPFEVGPVNVYLLESEPLTLIDTGPRTREALNALEQELMKAGYSFEDIGNIVITHGHLDHHGLANAIKTRSSAKLYVHKLDSKIVSYFEEEIKRYLEFFEATCIRSGVPEKLLGMISKYFKSMVKTCESAEVDFLIEDQDLIRVRDFALRVIHTPGHSPGSICLYFEERGILFSGDTLLSDITPNPSIDPGGGGLLSYLKSIEKLQMVDIKVAYPGHHGIIENHREVIKKIFEHHEIRKSRVLQAISSHPKTVFEISKSLFGDLPVSEVLLGVREVAGHLEILEIEDKVELRMINGIGYYSAKEARG